MCHLYVRYALLVSALLAVNEDPVYMVTPDRLVIGFRVTGRVRALGLSRPSIVASVERDHK